MDDEEPDHGDGGPTRAGVGIPRILVPRDNHRNDDVAAWSECLARVTAGVSCRLHKAVKQRDGKVILGERKLGAEGLPCPHADRSGCKDGSATELVDVKESGYSGEQHHDAHNACRKQGDGIAGQTEIAKDCRCVILEWSAISSAQDSQRTPEVRIAPDQALLELLTRIALMPVHCWKNLLNGHGQQRYRQGAR